MCYIKTLKSVMRGSWQKSFKKYIAEQPLKATTTQYINTTLSYARLNMTLHKKSIRCDIPQLLNKGSSLTLVLLDPDIYGFKHILGQIICH